MMDSDVHKILRAARMIDISVASMPVGRAANEAQRYYNQCNPDKPPAEIENDRHFLERITVEYLQYTCSRRKTISDFLSILTTVILVVKRKLLSKAGN